MTHRHLLLVEVVGSGPHDVKRVKSFEQAVRSYAAQWQVGIPAEDLVHYEGTSPDCPYVMFCIPLVGDADLLNNMAIDLHWLSKGFRVDARLARLVQESPEAGQEFQWESEVELTSTEHLSAMLNCFAEVGCDIKMFTMPRIEKEGGRTICRLRFEVPEEFEQSAFTSRLRRLDGVRSVRVTPPCGF